MSRVLSFFLTFLFLIHCQLVNADLSNEINSTENFIRRDEESLATVNNCVNVITGIFFQVDTDLIIGGTWVQKWKNDDFLGLANDSKKTS